MSRMRINEELLLHASLVYIQATTVVPVGEEDMAFFADVSWYRFSERAYGATEAKAQVKAVHRLAEQIQHMVDNLPGICG